MKVVVCDDDVTLRSVVSRMAEGVGHTVIAETDVASDAVELVTRFGAEILVLDLSLPWGSGMDAVHELKRRGDDCEIVVFTAYAEEYPDVRSAAVRAVVEKPDFAQLEAVLDGLAHGVPPPVAGVDHERRKPPRDRPNLPAPDVRSPSGLEEPETFMQVVRQLEPGDAVLYVQVIPAEGAAVDPWARLVHTDRFLAVARALRTVLRVQDRLTVDADQLAAVLLDAQQVGVESAWARLERAQELTSIGGIVSGGWALVHENEHGYEVQARARDAGVRSVGRPPGDRLWAG
jgi:CheY-like chemotaxis protein